MWLDFRLDKRQARAEEHSQSKSTLASMADSEGAVRLIGCLEMVSVEFVPGAYGASEQDCCAGV